MARWEYCRISWEEQPEVPVAQNVQKWAQEEGVSPPLRLLERLGSDAPAKRITKLDATIAQLGRDGWELVSHVQLHHGAFVQHWYFKRPLTDLVRTEF